MRHESLREERAKWARSEFLRSLREGPSAESIAKMSENLAAGGILSRPQEDGRESRRPFVHYKLLALLVIVGGSFFVLREARSLRVKSDVVVAVPPAPAPEVADGRPASLDARPPFPEKAAPEARKTTARPTSAAVSRSVEELPAVVPAPVSSARSPSPRAGAEAAPQPGEFELIRRAQAPLASDPEKALAFTREHARVFPSGEFVQEREIIAVEALSRLGRKDEALQRARALLRRFPRTPYAARLEMALGHPIAADSSNDPSQ